MRVSFVEGLCLVAAGVAMVELHDSQRVARPASEPVAGLATAAKDAAVVSTARAQGAFDLRSIRTNR